MALAVGYKDGFRKFETKMFEGFIFGDPKRNGRLIINGFSESDEQYTIILKGVDLNTTIEILNRIKTKYSVLTHCKPEYLSPSTDLLAIY